jgi:hypothetical protein
MHDLNKQEPDKDGERIIFVRRFWHWRAKRWIYPKRGRFIRIVLRRRRKRR